MAESRPFADERSLRLKRWGRVVGTAALAGLAVCAGVVAVQWHQIAPGLSRPRPVESVVTNAIADVRAGNKSLRSVPAQLTLIARPQTALTDPQDSVVVRSVASNVLVPVGAALRVAPSLERTEAEEALAARLLQSGQHVLNTAERLATAFKTGTAGSGPVGGSGSETFSDRFGRAVGGAPVLDSGPQ